MIDLKKNIDIIKHILPNGLNLAVVPLKGIPIVSINLTYFVGSYNEKIGSRGFAHLFEHLMFEGTKTLPKGEFDKICTLAGGSNNAYTTFNKTTYLMVLPSNQLELGIWLDSDRMFNSQVTQTALENQKKVVTEEIAQNVENRTYGTFRKYIAELAFDEISPYSWDVYGDKQDIAESTLELTTQFFNDYYKPGNASLVICGDCNPNEVIELTEKYFNQNTKNGETPLPDALNFIVKRGGYYHAPDEVPLSAVFLAFHLPDYSSNDNDTAEFISHILAFLVLTFLTFLFVGMGNLMFAVGPECGPDCDADNQFPQGAVNYHISTVFDHATLTFCTIRTKTKLYKFNCPPPTGTYYRYEIESIEVFGACTGLSQSQKIQMAIRSIISTNFGYLNSPAWIQLYSCAETVGTSPVREIIPCNYYCCRIYFEATWDEGGGTLDSLSHGGYNFNENYCPTYIGRPNCTFQCETDDDSFPTIGNLYTYNYIPQACFTSCGSTNDPIHRAVTDISSDMIYADYSLATNNDTLCFSFHWVNYEGTHDLDEVLVRLVKKVLKDIYDSHGNPNYITLNLAACWQKPYSGINLYYPCSQDDCCTMTFEIQSSTSAILDWYDHLGYNCQSPCTTEVCDIYRDFESSFAIGKSSIQFDLDQKSKSINIMPNPNSGTFNLEFNASVNEPHTILIINLMGLEVYSKIMNPTLGINYIDIDLTSLPTGAYYLHIVNKGLTTHKIKFIKN